MALRRTASSTRELAVEATGSGEARGFDKRTVGALLLELSLTAVGYYVVYLSAKSLIGMMDPTKKDRVSSAKVRVCGVCVGGDWGLELGGGGERELRAWGWMCARPDSLPLAYLCMYDDAWIIHPPTTHIPTRPTITGQGGAGEEAEPAGCEADGPERVRADDCGGGVGPGAVGGRLRHDRRAGGREAGGGWVLGVCVFCAFLGGVPRRMWPGQRGRGAYLGYVCALIWQCRAVVL
jgi:hypothetical protein